MEDEKEAKPITNNAPVVKRVYAKPELVEFGDVRELTCGASGPRNDSQFQHRV
jgi:hypothetical protein